MKPEIEENPKNVYYVVTCCDTGDSCDGKPRFGKLFKTYEEAKDWVKKDIEDYEDTGHYVDYDEMSADTCEWNIEKVKLDI